MRPRVLDGFCNTHFRRQLEDVIRTTAFERGIALASENGIKINDRFIVCLLARQNVGMDFSDAVKRSQEDVAVSIVVDEIRGLVERRAARGR